MQDAILHLAMKCFFEIILESKLALLLMTCKYLFIVGNVSMLKSFVQHRHKNSIHAEGVI